VYEATLTIL